MIVLRRYDVLNADGGVVDTVFTSNLGSDKELQRVAHAKASLKFGEAMKFLKVVFSGMEVRSS